MSTQIIICNDFGFINGGAAKVAIKSAIALANKGYEVTFFCGVGPIDDELSKSVKKVVCLYQKDILNNPSRVNAIIQGIWNRRAEKEMNDILKGMSGKIIVHIHGWTKSLTASIVKACYRNNINPYISIHDYFAACPNGGFYNYKKDRICDFKGAGMRCLFCDCDSRNYFHKMWRFVRQVIQDKYIRKSSRIIYIGTSNFSYNAIKTSLRSQKVEWVRNSIDIYSGTIVDCSKNDIFLFIGRLSKEKGADLFCEAISETGSKGIVIGSGDELEVYRQKYPNINFVGWKNFDEIEEYAQKSRALVVSSRYYEGSPLIVPEMQSRGLPCIVPDRCAASDTIKNGINGIIFQSGDLNSLCEAIKTVKQSGKDSKLFNPNTWNNEYISMENHISELLHAYGEN